MSKLKFHNGLAWEALDAANGDSVNGISFRINGGKLQYTTNGTTWYDAGTDTSDATALAGDILSGKTAYVNGIKITGTIPSKGAQTYTPGTSNQTISANQFLSGIQTIAGDADLTAANIKYNANIFNVVGTFSYTTSGATAAQILSGRVAFVNGAQVTGTIPSKGAQTYTPGTTNQTITANQFLSANQTILGDADLVAANIKKDVNLFNVTGTLEAKLASDMPGFLKTLTAPTRVPWSYASDGTTLMVGADADGYIFYSTNGGNTWTQNSLTNPGGASIGEDQVTFVHFPGVGFYAALNEDASTYVYLYKSATGGASGNWTYISKELLGKSDSKPNWAISDTGIIVLTGEGKVIRGTTTTSFSTYTVASVLTNSGICWANGYFYVGGLTATGGIIYRSSDGITWTSVYTDSSSAVYGNIKAIGFYGGRIIASTYQGMYYSTNGTTWVLGNSAGEGADDCVTLSSGLYFSYLYSGNLIKTTNGVAIYFGGTGYYDLADIAEHGSDGIITGRYLRTYITA